MDELKKVLVKASEIREVSWDGSKYTKNIQQAIDESTENTDLRQISYLLLVCCWNDALIFAGVQ
jgi:hypothetical protein